MKCSAPRCQCTCRSLTRNDATIMRTRLCIQPSARSCRIPASTSGYPVRPAAQAATRAASTAPDAHASSGTTGRIDVVADSGAWNSTSA